VHDNGASVAASFGYERIDTPLFEETSLFRKGVGEETEVVEHQMYTFEDHGGDEMTLRAEGTAPVCRAYIQRGMSNRPQPVRLYYQCPIFRYERPQAGRFRQHHQFGVEAIGDASPQVDAEVIELGWSYLSSLGLRGLKLRINSIGDAECRPAYLGRLTAHFATHEGDLCKDHRRRYQSNPLRVLDCKREGCRTASSGAPASIDHLCEDCNSHWEELIGLLDQLVHAESLLPYTVDSSLVRGLDYYTRTVFEFEPPEEAGQSTLLGGGRYDPLIELLDGQPTPGIGFGSGIERVILNLEKQGVGAPSGAALDVVGVHIGDAARGRLLTIASGLRALGHGMVLAPHGRGMRSQMRYANGLRARYALILGDRDLEAGVATLRPLVGDGDQVEVSLDVAAISSTIG
jgi:histidyl-tRNA synthetase